MSKYEIIIYWSNEDNAFIAEVPELPGCMADGNTYQHEQPKPDRVSAKCNGNRPRNLTIDTPPRIIQSNRKTKRSIVAGFKI